MMLLESYFSVLCYLHIVYIALAVDIVEFGTFC